MASHMELGIEGLMFLALPWITPLLLIPHHLQSQHQRLPQGHFWRSVARCSLSMRNLYCHSLGIQCSDVCSCCLHHGLGIQCLDVCNCCLHHSSSFCHMDLQKCSALARYWHCYCCSLDTHSILHLHTVGHTPRRTQTGYQANSSCTVTRLAWNVPPAARPSVVVEVLLVESCSLCR